MQSTIDASTAVIIFAGLWVMARDLRRSIPRSDDYRPIEPGSLAFDGKDNLPSHAFEFDVHDWARLDIADFSGC